MPYILPQLLRAKKSFSASPDFADVRRQSEEEKVKPLYVGRHRRNACVRACSPIWRASIDPIRQV